MLLQPPALVARLHPGAAAPPTLGLLGPGPALHHTQQPAGHRRRGPPTATQIALAGRKPTPAGLATGRKDSYLYCDTKSEPCKTVLVRAQRRSRRVPAGGDAAGREAGRLTEQDSAVSLAGDDDESQAVQRPQASS